jgi:putative ABC transport system ATP-binding protein
MMGLLDEPTAGQIFIKDQNISSIKEKELPAIRSKELGFVFQSFNLIPTLSALENVMIPLRYAGVSLRKRRQMAKEALEKVDMGDRLDHNPNELSGGQRQRVAIARSIVNNPAIIFGDELTGELDSKMTADVMRLIKQLNRNGQTFVIVTHNPEVARECRRTIHMKDGQVERDLVTSK